MGWNLKQQAKDRIVTGLFALVVLLLLVVWRAIPSSVWDKVSEATPKRALWALLALAGIAICFLSGALIDNWRKKSATPPVIPKKVPRYGVYWDKNNQNPYCPNCGKIMTFLSHGLISDHQCDYVWCPACTTQVALYDPQFGGLELGQAQNLIAKDISEGRLSD